MEQVLSEEITPGMIVEVPAAAMSAGGWPFLGTVRSEQAEGVWEIYVPELKRSSHVDAKDLVVMTRKRRYDDMAKFMTSTTAPTQSPPSSPPSTPSNTQNMPPVTPETLASRRAQAEKKRALREMFQQCQERCVQADKTKRVIAKFKTTLEDSVLDRIKYRGLDIFDKRNAVLMALDAEFDTEEKVWYVPKGANLAKYHLFREAARTWLRDFKQDSDDPETYKRQCAIARENGAKFDKHDRQLWFVPGYIIDHGPLIRAGLLPKPEPSQEESKVPEISMTGSI